MIASPATEDDRESSEMKYLITLMKGLCRIIVNITDSSEAPWQLCQYYENMDPEPEVYELGDIYEVSKTVFIVLYAVVTAFACVGNSAVIVIFASDRALRCAVHSVFIFSLAASDLLIAVFCMLFNLESILCRTWNFGELSKFTCKLAPFVQSVAVGANMLTLGCIALERYLSVLYPVQARHLQTLTRAAASIVAVWIVSAIAAVPNLIWYHLVEASNVKVCIT